MPRKNSKSKVDPSSSWFVFIEKFGIKPIGLEFPNKEYAIKAAIKLSRATFSVVAISSDESYSRGEGLQLIDDVEEIPNTDFEMIQVGDRTWRIVRRGHSVQKSQRATTVIRDIEPYKAIGIDVASGTAPVIGSRAEHRAYLRRNNYVEVGNEPGFKQTGPSNEFSTQQNRVNDIKRAMGEL